MSIILGKRKRRGNQGEDSLNTLVSANQTQYQDALRKHFEATFESAESTNLITSPGSSSEANSVGPQDEHTDTNSGSEWEGISDVENVEVISHVSASIFEDDAHMSKSLRKQYMSSKPPQAVKQIAKSLRQSRSNEDTSQKASSLMAEDIELQRLLSESHLLQGATSTALMPTLKTRQAAQDLRLQTLGAKQSLDAIGAGNAPMAVRKGMEYKKRAKEQARRQEARESGIVLEKGVTSSSKIKRRKRDRDVGAPAVGKWRSGTLTLGKRDLAEIQGQKSTNAYGKKRKGKTKAKGNKKFF